MAGLGTAATFNTLGLIMNIRAVSMFTGKLIHLAAVVHNVQYGSNIFLKLSDAILDRRRMCERHVSNSRCNKETGWTQSCGELQGVQGLKPEPSVPGFHVCVFYIWVNVNLRACTLTPGCHSCWGHDRLMFLAQRSVAPLQPWWFSGLSWKSHTIHWHWSWKWKHGEHQTLT